MNLQFSYKPRVGVFVVRRAFGSAMWASCAHVSSAPYEPWAWHTSRVCVARRGARSARVASALHIAHRSLRPCALHVGHGERSVLIFLAAHSSDARSAVRAVASASIRFVSSCSSLTSWQPPVSWTCVRCCFLCLEPSAFFRLPCVFAFCQPNELIKLIELCLFARSSFFPNILLRYSLQLIFCIAPINALCNYSIIDLIGWRHTFVYIFCFYWYFFLLYRKNFSIFANCITYF